MNAVISLEYSLLLLCDEIFKSDSVYRLVTLCFEAEKVEGVKCVLKSFICTDGGSTVLLTKSYNFIDLSLVHILHKIKERLRDLPKGSELKANPQMD